MGVSTAGPENGCTCYTGRGVAGVLFRLSGGTHDLMKFYLFCTNLKFIKTHKTSISYP